MEGVDAECARRGAGRRAEIGRALELKWGRNVEEFFGGEGRGCVSACAQRRSDGLGSGEMSKGRMAKGPKWRGFEGEGGFCCAGVNGRTRLH